MPTQSFSGGPKGSAPSPLEGLKLGGKADLRADLAYHPGTSQPLTYDVWLKVMDGKVRHPKLPLPLEELEFTCHCANGYLLLEGLKAKSGPTEITAHGSALLATIDKDFQAHFEARHLEMSERLLEMSEKLFADLPDETPKLYPWFLPTGLATLRADVARKGGAWIAGVYGRTIQHPVGLGNHGNHLF